MNTSGRRWLVAGVVAAAIPYFVLGFAFLRTGFLFLIAPDALADAGFVQDPPLGARVAGLVFFAGVGACPSLFWLAARPPETARTRCRAGAGTGAGTHVCESAFPRH
jgi:hypothetical protein